MNPLMHEDVLDHGYVELIDIMPSRVPCPNPDCFGGKTKVVIGTTVMDTGFICQYCGGTGEIPRDIAIVNAARTSYLGESKGLEADKRLLRFLFENQHTGPFEQVELQFKVKAPVVVWWQWVRHRTWSYNLQSGRYTQYKEEFYCPEEWRLQDQKNKQGSSEETIQEAEMNYTFGTFPISDVLNISDLLRSHVQTSQSIYQSLLKAGVAREQARLFLPAFCLYHVGVCKVDAHNLMHFLRLRTDEHAQWEIRQYALAVERMFAQMLPWTYELYQEEK